MNNINRCQTDSFSYNKVTKGGHSQMSSYDIVPPKENFRGMSYGE